MKRLLLLFMAVFLVTVIASCDNDDDNSTGPAAEIDGLSLMGFADDRSLEYFQIDTTVTFDPFSTIVATTVETLTVRGGGEDWVIYDNGHRMLNLKVSAPYVLQNGYWYDDGSSEALTYFPTPSILMPRTLTVGGSWESYSPAYVVDTSTSSFPCYYAYFGFNVVKTYIGIEEVMVPAGAYNAYRFDVDLFRYLTDTVAVATATEYYYPSVGMVKQTFEARPGFVRTLNLIRVNEP